MELELGNMQEPISYLQPWRVLRSQFLQVYVAFSWVQLVHYHIIHYVAPLLEGR